MSLNVTNNVTSETFDKIILSIFSKSKDNKSNSPLSYLFLYDSEFHYSEEPVKVVKIKVMILGFAKYSYSTSTKIINFFMYFIYMEKTTSYAKKIIIKAQLKYKTSTRMLQEQSKEGECTWDGNSKPNSPIKYVCNIETNGKEIDNVKLDKNIIAGEGEV